MSARGALPPGELTPAERLLVACAAAQAGAATDTVAGALSAPGLDWPAVVRLSLEHGMAPLVARELSDFRDDPRIPAGVAACFARMAEANAFRNRVLFRETARLVRALEAAEIRALVLKGVGLALTIYADPALRSFADIDLLVRPEDLEAADHVARTCGFRREDGGTSPVFYHSEHVATCEEDILTELLAPEYDPRVSAETIARLGHRVPLEIHFGLFCLPSGALRRVDMEPFWERAQVVILPDGTRMRVPSPEAMLVHLAAHAAGDLFRKLVFAVDIALLLRRYAAALDWARVTALADRYAVLPDLRRMLEFLTHLPESRMATDNTDDTDIKVLNPCSDGSGCGDDTDIKVLNPCSSVASAQSVIQTQKKEAPLTPADIFAAARMDSTALVWRRWKRARNTRERLLSFWQILFPAPATMRRFYHVRSPLQVGLCYLLRPFLLASRLAVARIPIRPAHSRR
ncbi:MAG TPA: nucleotidyltransferase family protein [Chthonomonadaceae bacterium]|nr:nucleotidyltransferase family protein [Chthonomonadaceae bacterium]